MLDNIRILPFSLFYFFSNGGIAYRSRGFGQEWETGSSFLLSSLISRRRFPWDRFGIVTIVTIVMIVTIVVDNRHDIKKY
jgi:hypothetical protein